MTDDAAEVLAALTALAPEGVAVGVLPIDDAHLAALRADEASLVAAAVPTRQREFATGRALLRRLTDCTGSILRASNGAPVPPAGKVLTLAHVRSLAIAAVAEANGFQALGIDLERMDEEDDELRAAVLRSDDAPLPAVAAFVIKEAAYKAWSDHASSLVGPLDAHLTVDGSRFAVAFPDGRRVEGSLAAAAGYWIALAVTLR